MARFGHDGYWAHTRRNALVALSLWLSLGFILPLAFAGAESPRFFGLPFGLLFGAVLMPLVLIVLVVRFANRQDAIDRDDLTPGRD